MLETSWFRRIFTSFGETKRSISLRAHDEPT